MIVTEEEAKTKCCVDPGLNAAHRGDHCIGTACMAFRKWRPAATEQWEKIAVPPDDRGAYLRQGYEDDPTHRGGMRKLMQNAAPALHYCAKVGKP